MAKTGSNMQGRKIDKVAESLTPQELARRVRKRDIDGICQTAQLDADNAIKLCEVLADPKKLAEIEAIDIDDVPVIELKDGEDYKHAAALSTGQRCTVILPILLLDSQRPLLIDQPEDNLDNAYIFETVVQNVLTAKESRQLILVTHNPNIPVLGDAEQVFVFGSDGKHGWIERRGGVDDVKSSIENLLEGGAEAFRQRMERYGHRLREVA
ncbi:MAG: hypothetical protein U9Q07_08595 [Planctomycetota bacterium]|nr:hypothetical protein [Planctomycetota bacterium]